MSNPDRQINYYIPTGRAYAYSYVLGILDTVWENYGDMSLPSILKSVKDGNVIKDFYSGIMIPVFYILILILTFISVNSIVYNIYKDRKYQIAVLRTQGLSAKDSFIYLYLDNMLLVLVMSLIGLGLGCLAHIGMIRFVNSVLDLNLRISLTDINPYVKAVTINPYICPIISVVICALLSVTFVLLRIYKTTPIELLRTSNTGKAKKKVSGHLSRNCE